MRNAVFVILAIVALADSAAAQSLRSRWYIGGGGGTTNVITDEVNRGGVMELSGLAGVWLTDRFGIEIDLGAAIDEQRRERVGWRVSFAGPDASREEIEEMAVTERISTRSRQTFNATALLVWRDRDPGRVAFTLFVGPTWNRYEHVETSEILRLPPGVTAEQVARTLRPSENNTRLLGGLTCGFNLPIAIGRDLRLAPEVSYTHGDAGDHHYHLLSGRVKLLWHW